jgi:uncharacterized membrane protein YtjA (UPF0391 family)
LSHEERRSDVVVPHSETQALEFHENCLKRLRPIAWLPKQKFEQKLDLADADCFEQRRLQCRPTGWQIGTAYRRRRNHRYHRGLTLQNGVLGAQEMLGLVITLLIIALIAGILGFGGIAGTAIGIAKIVCIVFLVLFLISLVTSGMRGGFSRRL